METKNKTTIQSLEIGFKIINSIASHSRPLKFTEICEETGITKSNLYKYLNTLTQLQVLYRDPKMNEYSFGAKIIEYGLHALKNEDVISKITPALEEMNQTVGETVLFSVFTDKGPVVVQLIKSTNNLINIGADIGTLLPIYTSSGKVFAAFLESLKARNWKEYELNNLPKDKQVSLEQEILQTKLDGITYASEPLAPSVSSISIPIFNYSKDLLGVVTVVGFMNQEGKMTFQDLKNYLLMKAKEISSIFGG